MKEGVARERFKRLVVERFDFLRTEYECSRTIRAGGAEYVPTYRNQELEVRLTFAYPELPLLEIDWNDGESIRAFRYGPTKTGAEASVRKLYYKLIEATPRNGTPGSEETFELASKALDFQVLALRRALQGIRKGRAPRGPWVKGRARPV